MPATEQTNDYLSIADKNFTSRLFLGTGKFSSYELMQQAFNAVDSALITVALKRANIKQAADDSEPILDYLQKKNATLVINTSGAINAKEAVRLARLTKALNLEPWIKLEIHPDHRYLLPDPIETLAATEVLANEGFVVLPYIHADPVLAKRLESAGAAAVMPLGSPIGSCQGLKTMEFLQIIIAEAEVPVIVDAGIGAPSDAAKAMEIGADAVLVNTAIAISQNPITMAQAFTQSIAAGRAYYLQQSQPIPTVNAVPTSPLTGFLD